MDTITIPLKLEFKTMADLIFYVSKEFDKQKSKLGKPTAGMKRVFTTVKINRDEVIYKAVQTVQGDD